MKDENEITKVQNIIIPKNKLYALIKELKEERNALSPDIRELKIQLRRYKLKVQFEILNGILHHNGVDHLFGRLCPNKRIKNLVKEIVREEKKDDNNT